MRRYATVLVGRAGEADDLVQDCVERALRRSDALQQADRLGPWLRSILHNLHIDNLRRRATRGQTVELRDIEDDLSASAPPEDRSGVRDFVRATMSLSVEHRQILLLVGVEGLSYREVADELHLPIGTVMSRLSRARERLRQALDAGPSEKRDGKLVELPLASNAGERQRKGG